MIEIFNLQSTFSSSTSFRTFKICIVKTYAWSLVNGWEKFIIKKPQCSLPTISCKPMIVFQSLYSWSLTCLQMIVKAVQIKHINVAYSVFSSINIFVLIVNIICYTRMKICCIWSSLWFRNKTSRNNAIHILLTMNRTSLMAMY